jgi:hypothetical protein
MVTTLLLVNSTARAAFDIGSAANFAVLFEGAGNNHLSINNGTITGNIGIGDPSGVTTAQAQLNSPLTINGNILFGGAVNEMVGSDVVVNGTTTGNNANVQSDLLLVNNLSSMLGAESGNSLTVNLNNNQSQTVNASAGKLVNGDRVFTVSSFNFGNGATLTIDGSASDHVVFNFAGDASFGGKIVLTGGITSDQVIFNVTGGSGMTGGHTLSINSNGAILTGTFLDPNGAIQINHSVLDGRLFGGDMHDEMIVSGDTLVGLATAPEPGLTGLFSGLALAAFSLNATLRSRRQAGH